MQGLTPLFLAIDFQHKELLEHIYICIILEGIPGMFRFQFCWSVESRGHLAGQATAGNTILRSGRVEFQIAASSEVLTAY
jgi:signal recognition particle receptor subunit beta